MTSDVLLDGLCFAEGPRWREGRLWFSDIFNQRVIAVDELGHAEVVVQFDGAELPVGLGFLPDGRLLMTDLEAPRVLRLDGPGRVQVHADLANLSPGGVNDMAVDATGRAYVGALGLRDADAKVVPGTGAIVSVEADGSARVVAEHVHAPNGPCITKDGSKYIVSEHPEHRLLAFDRAPDGSLHNRRVWADLAPFLADGITVDAEDGVWTSSTGDSVYRRVLEGGEVTHVIEVPGRRAVACCLGGENEDTLFLLTNKSSEIARLWAVHKFTGKGPSVQELREREEWVANSRIETVKLDVPRW